MDQIIKRIPDLRPAAPLKSSDMLIVSQYVQGTNKVRRTTVGAVKDVIISGFPNDPFSGGSGGGSGGNLVIDENTVRVRINNEFIQWSFQDGSWYNLIKLSDLKTAAVPEMSFFTGNGVQKEFGPVAGLTNSNPNKCLVVIGGVTQRPTISYTLSTDNGGKIIFDEAPPKDLEITVQPY